MSKVGWIFGGLASIAALVYLQIAADAQRTHSRHLTTCTNKVASLEAEIKIQKSLVTEARLAASHYERELSQTRTNYWRLLNNVKSMEESMGVMSKALSNFDGDVKKLLAEGNDLKAERDHYKDLLYQLMVPADLKKELGIYSLNPTNTPNANDNKPK
jgi:regulator of replication initiation timing